MLPSCHTWDYARILTYYHSFKKSCVHIYYYMVQVAKPLNLPVVADESKRPSGVYPKDKAGAPLLENRYAIMNFLGEGGISSVNRAIDRDSGSEVVVKMMLDSPEYRSNSSVQMLFVCEAQILAQLSDVKGIVKLLGSGTADGLPYLVLNYLGGDELAFLMRSFADSPENLLDIISRSCRRMAEVHRRGVIHRDIKPQNILVEVNCDNEWEPTILDFGHSRGPDVFDVYEHVNEAIGTPEYASPEAILGGRNLDHRTDIYSMGAILYEALAGEPPFVQGPASTEEQVLIEREKLCQRVLIETPKPLSDLVGWIPKELAEIVMKALAKNPGERFQAMDLLADAIDSVLPYISNKDARTLASPSQISA